LTADELRLLLTSEGDTFSQEEIEEMLSSAIDPIEGKLFYDVRYCFPVAILK
jgi:Ca2+-binding EF-hand superfamily protein